MMKIGKFDIDNIYCGDSRELMKDIPDKSVDLILTDPPYNISSESKLTRKHGIPISTKVAWGGEFPDEYTSGDYTELINTIAIQGYRILKDNGSILLFFDRGKPYLLKPLYDLFKFRNMIVFAKINPIPNDRRNNYRSAYEQCAWFSKDKYKLNFISQSLMKNIFYGLIGAHLTDHPTEKYTWMIEPLVERHSERQDIIFDPFLGSGTTAAVAKELHRHYLGFEINPIWYETAIKRMELVKPRVYVSEWFI